MIVDKNFAVNETFDGKIMWRLRQKKFHHQWNHFEANNLENDVHLETSRLKIINYAYNLPLVILYSKITVFLIVCINIKNIKTSWGWAVPSSELLS